MAEVKLNAKAAVRAKKMSFPPVILMQESKQFPRNLRLNEPFNLNDV